jgi:predicted helicase
MVILGNPPYSGHSANKGDWIMNLLRGRERLQGEGNTYTFKLTHNYFEVDGQPLGERNPKWLNDDYVKFIRFAQWRIEQTGYGILAFITNHGYLDNPTFRGMRQSLMQTFDEIYVLDLHGNSKKKERAPDGGKDENVFDIQQGVAIGIFVKRAPTQTTPAAAKPPATVHHAHLWGERASKYQWLSEQEQGITSTEWKTLSPQTPYYLFAPQDATFEQEYEQGWKIPEIFGTGNPRVDGGKAYGLGICTHNDLLYVGWTEAEVRSRVQRLASQSISDAEILQTLPVEESRYWNTTREREKVRKSQWAEKIWQIYYRPFDWRFIYYEPDLMEIGRVGASRQVMPHAKRSPRSLLVSRGYEIDSFEHVLVANAVAVHHAATRKEGHYVFPLYLYPDTTKGDLWGENMPTNAPDGRRPNLAPKFIEDFGAKLGLTWVEDGKGDRQQTFGPEDVFSYLYAVFHAPSYRERYAEFLKIDFPRLPLTSNADLFRALCALGDELVRLHLLEGDISLITSYPERGNNRVENVRYTDPIPGEAQGRVYINTTQYFDGVPPEVWAFHVGGYQVCQKWLKDRKGRTLTFDEIEHYQKTIAALSSTIQLMDQIDDAIEEYGGWPIA